jgi:hypothetical protein
MVFAKLKKLFPPKKFLLKKISFFLNTNKKSFGGKKINLAKKIFNLAKKVGPIKMKNKKNRETHQKFS